MFFFVEYLKDIWMFIGSRRTLRFLYHIKLIIDRSMSLLVLDMTIEWKSKLLMLIDF